MTPFTYARAKSRADVAGAMAVCAESFVLDTPAFGIASRNRDETVGHLGAFFHAFPDYGVTVDASTFGPAAAACWGTSTGSCGRAARSSCTSTTAGSTPGTAPAAAGCSER